MPIQKLIQAAVPFVAGGAVAIFVAELTRTTGSVRSEGFSETWFREADTTPENLWVGEPTFDWGD